MGVREGGGGERDKRVKRSRSERGVGGRKKGKWKVGGSGERGRGEGRGVR